MRDHNIRLEYRTPRASRSNAGAPSSFELLKDTIFLEYKDEIVIVGKGLELVLDLEAKIPVEVAIRLPNHIDEEYPFIDLDSIDLEQDLKLE